MDKAANLNFAIGQEWIIRREEQLLLGLVDSIEA